MPWNACHSTRVKWYHMHIAFVVVVGALSESLLVSRCHCVVVVVSWVEGDVNVVGLLNDGVYW